MDSADKYLFVIHNALFDYTGLRAVFQGQTAKEENINETRRQGSGAGNDGETAPEALQSKKAGAGTRVKTHGIQETGYENDICPTRGT